MAFFPFPWPGRKAQDDGKPAKRPRTLQPPPGSIELIRRRARHRLIGAAVLVLLAVVGFPLLFDTQPRPIPVDIPIDIPGRNQAPPLVAAAGDGLADGEEVVTSKPAVVAPAAAPALPVPPLPVVAPKPEPKPAPKPEVKPEPKPAPRPEPKPEPKVEHKPEPRPEPKPEPKPAPRVDEAARARALLEGRSIEPAPAAAAQDARFIVQVGAFGDADKAREVRSKLERAGLKTYSQVVDTKDGKRTRVRVGPFANRSEADKAAARIKGLDLPASVLTL
jgi:DedD protein